MDASHRAGVWPTQMLVLWQTNDEVVALGLGCPREVCVLA
jgi:hypothetical protein